MGVGVQYSVQISGFGNLGPSNGCLILGTVMMGSRSIFPACSHSGFWVSNTRYSDDEFSIYLPPLFAFWIIGKIRI